LVSEGSVWSEDPDFKKELWEHKEPAKPHTPSSPASSAPPPRKPDDDDTREAEAWEGLSQYGELE
jgi:hypothetical protein